MVLLATMPFLAACAPRSRIPETGEVADVLNKLQELPPYEKIAATHTAMRELSRQGRDGERASALAQDLLARGEYDLVDALEQIAEDDLRARYWGAVDTWAQWYPECKRLLDRFVRRREQLTPELAIRGGSHPSTWELLVSCALDPAKDGCTRIRAAGALAVHAPNEVFGRILRLRDDRLSFGAPASKYGRSLVIAEEFEKLLAQRQKFGWGKRE
jgi:hypothetical protein